MAARQNPVMFVRLTHHEDGQSVHIRSSRVQAFVSTEEGGTRIFLSGALSVLVAEDAGHVEALLSPPAGDRPD